MRVCSNVSDFNNRNQLLTATVLITWFIIAVRQNVKSIDNTVVVHELELAIKRDL